MEIPNYDFNEDENTNFKQLYKYMPKSNLRMLIYGNSGSGKTNLLYHILMKPLVYYDQIHLYGKNLEQEKYRHMISRELNVTKDQYIKATKQPYSFLYVDKPMKTVKRNFYGNI